VVSRALEYRFGSGIGSIVLSRRWTRARGDGLRRGAGYFLVSLGLMLLSLGVLAKAYIVPHVKRIPTDFYFREVSEGTGTYLNPAEGFAQVGPVPVRNVTTQRGDTDASSDDVAVWDQFTSTFDVENNHELTFDIDRLTLQRTTAASVNCCGQNERRTGALTALFPIGTEKRTYSFWDDNAVKAFPIRYMDTTIVDGLSVYRFHQSVPPMQINHLGLPGSAFGEPELGPTLQLSWWYSGETDVWVEPVTGGIVKASQHADQWLEDPDGKRVLTLATIDAGWDGDTVARAVRDATTQRDQLHLLQNTVPVVGPIAGVVLIVVGLLLLRSQRPGRSPHPAGEPAPAPAA
jgi:DUF3068 family protein